MNTAKTIEKQQEVCGSVENNNANYSIKDSKYFDYKTSVTGKLEGIDAKKDAEIVMPLKHLSNFGEH